MKKKKENNQLSLSVMASLVIVVTLALFFVIYLVVYNIIENVAKDRLDEAAIAATEKVDIIFKSNANTLENIARSIEKLDDIEDEELIKIVNAFLPKNGTNRISAIFPDDRIVTLYGNIYHSDLSFDAMKTDIERGDTFSRRDVSRLYKDEVIIRQYQPVYKDGEMTMILYAIYDCNDMSDFTENAIFDDQYNMQIIDTRDGKVVADAYFDSVLDTDQYTIDGSRLKNGGKLRLSRILKGGKGNVLYLNDYLKQYVFLSYVPSSFKEYLVAIFVPESAVLSELSLFNVCAGICGIGEIFLLVLFGLWVKNKNKHDLEHYLEERKKATELKKLKKGREIDANKDEVENVFLALAEGYDTVCYINFDTCEIRSFKEGKAFAMPAENLEKVRDYHAVTREYAKIKAIEEDREMLIERMSFKSIWEDISKGRAHVTRFRSGDEDSPEVIEIKHVHLAEYGDEHSALVCFKFVDEK